MNSNPLAQQTEYILTDIITPEDQAQAKADVQADSDIRFRSGRMSLKYQALLDGELSKTAVREAVARVYHCAATTIRQRDGVCKLISDDLRAAHPLLSYCYWRAVCRAQPAHDQTKLDALLDYVYQIEAYHEAYDKLPGVALVEVWVSGQGGGVLWVERGRSVLTTLEKIEHDQHLPPAGKALFGWVRAIIGRYLDDGVSPLLESERKEELSPRL